MLAVFGDDVADARDRRRWPTGSTSACTPIWPRPRTRTDSARRCYGCRPLDYLEQCGWLNERTWLAHGIIFNADEMKRLGKARTAISHCACSNQILASGCCPVCEMEEAGVAIGLGVDGSASNDESNLMQEVRAAFLLQRGALRRRPRQP